MDIPPEGQAPKADDEPIPLANLALDEKYKNNGARVILQLYGATGTTTVTPAGSVCYLYIRDDLKSKAKQAIDSDSNTSIALVAQAFLDIKFSLSVHLKNKDAVICDLYYDSTSNNLVIRNRSVVKVDICPVSDSKANTGHDSEPLLPRESRHLGPGTYGIIIHEGRVLDLRVLARVDILDTTRKLARPAVPSTNAETPLKRALPVSEGELNESPDTPLPRVRKVGHAMDSSSVLFLGTGANKILSSQSLVATGNPLVDLSQHGVLDIPGVLDMEGYQIHKRKVISARAQSEVYLAQHSGIDNGEIAVKVLKIRRSTSTDKGRPLVDQAEAWLQEYNAHNGLKHESIVGLYGGDARFLTFYQEFVPGHDLSTKGVWRNTADHYFRGTEDDAFRVWIGIASALEYLHDQGLEHNDIKPGNILLSEERGAVLCDFGLSRQSDPSNPTTGGTPFYVPPEYIAVKQRGKPGDVFALGVTMQYLRQLRPLPDAEGGDFMIAAIHSQERVVRQAARNKMASCLAKVEAARTRLDLSSTGASILWDMLSPKVMARPTATEVVNRLKSELYTRNRRPQVKKKSGDRVVGKRDRGGSQKSIDHGSTTEENESIEWVPISPRQ